MEVTEKNCRVADKIIEILVNEKCTVEETQDILSEVTREVRRTSTVQVGRKFSKVYHECDFISVRMLSRSSSLRSEILFRPPAIKQVRYVLSG